MPDLKPDSPHTPAKPDMNADTESKEPGEKSLDFIRQKIADDIAAGRHQTIVTRFPPEPNGFLHVGHAKAVCINFGIAEEVNAGKLGTGPGGAPTARCHLRFDDTNPAKEEQRYIDGIKNDVRWLGFDWGEHEYHASDYYEQLYDWACGLILSGNAYVDQQSADEIRQNRGTLTTPGVNSPFRDRPAEESLEILTRMRGGEYENGKCVLRAKIDMASPNINMRDPVMYRILHESHPRTGNDWCIYPMYDYAHGQSDWIEGVTHSLCSLEFEAHRPLYDWFVDKLMDAGCHPRRQPDGSFDRNDRPRQTEFNRLSLEHTETSKRRLRQLVETHRVEGWDDPRMPTLSAMRRRGYPADAIRGFVKGAGLSKRDQVIEPSRLEHAIREDLNRHAQRRMAVLDPLKVVITNYPEGQVEHLDAVNNPESDADGHRQVPFSRELYIERSDFMEDPPKKFFRLGPGREVRLRYAYWVTCTDFVKNDAGEVTELHCTYDPQTRGGDSPPPDAEGKVRKVKGTLHWVSAQHAVDATVRMYQPLFLPDSSGDGSEAGKTDDKDAWLNKLNPDSLQTIENAKVEPALAEAKPGEPLQFERTGYFVLDGPEFGEGGGEAANPDAYVFNQTVGLKDSWAKQSKK